MQNNFNAENQPPNGGYNNGYPPQNNWYPPNYYNQPQPTQNIEPPKKPFWKIGWFLGFIIFLLLFLALLKACITFVNDEDSYKETIKDLTAQNLKLKSENKKYKNLLGIIDNKQKSSNNSNNKKSTLSFGQTADLINGDKIIQMQVESVKSMDPNEAMVTDISHNEADKKQFVIVSYKITAEKGGIDLDQFDGSELSIADATGENGTQSSNRDNGVPKTLAQGQSITLRIGAGFKNKGNTATVKFSGNTWSGNIF